MSIRTNSKSIGNNDAKSSEIAAAIRSEWLKAKPERQSEIATEFKIGYIAGRERISLSEAQAIVEAGKGAGATKAHIAMIDRATSGFAYHIRNGKTKPAAQGQASFRISREMRDTAMDFLGNFEGDDLTAQINAAIKLLQAMK